MIAVAVSVLLASLAASVAAVCPTDTLNCIASVTQTQQFASCSPSDKSCACPEFQNINNCIAICPDSRNLITQAISQYGVDVSAVEALCSSSSFSPSSPSSGSGTPPSSLANCDTAALQQCLNTAVAPAQKCTSATDYSCACPVYQSAVGCADKCPGSKDLIISQLKKLAGSSTDADNLVKTCDGWNSGGLSTGAIAGIAVGCSVLVLALAGLAIFFLMRRRKQNAGNAPTPKPAPANTSDVVSADPAFFSYPMPSKQDSQMMNPHGQQPQFQPVPQYQSVPQYQQQPQHSVYQPQHGHEQQTQYYPQSQVSQYPQSQAQHNFAR